MLPDVGGVLAGPVLLAELWECCLCQKGSNQQHNVAGERCHTLRHCLCGDHLLSSCGVRSAAVNTALGVYLSGTVSWRKKVE